MMASPYIGRERHMLIVMGVNLCMIPVNLTNTATRNQKKEMKRKIQKVKKKNKEAAYY